MSNSKPTTTESFGGNDQRLHNDTNDTKNSFEERQDNKADQTNNEENNHTVENEHHQQPQKQKRKQIVIKVIKRKHKKENGLKPNDDDDDEGGAGNDRNDDLLHSHAKEKLDNELGSQSQAPESENKVTPSSKQAQVATTTANKTTIVKRIRKTKTPATPVPEETDADRVKTKNQPNSAGADKGASENDDDDDDDAGGLVGMLLSPVPNCPINAFTVLSNGVLVTAHDNGIRCFRAVREEEEGGDDDDDGYDDGLITKGSQKGDRRTFTFGSGNDNSSFFSTGRSHTNATAASAPSLGLVVEATSEWASAVTSSAGSLLMSGLSGVVGGRGGGDNVLLSRAGSTSQQHSSGKAVVAHTAASSSTSNGGGGGSGFFSSFFSAATAAVVSVGHTTTDHKNNRSSQQQQTNSRAAADGQSDEFPVTAAYLKHQQHAQKLIDQWRRRKERLEAREKAKEKARVERLLRKAERVRRREEKQQRAKLSKEETPLGKGAASCSAPSSLGHASSRSTTTTAAAISRSVFTSTTTSETITKTTTQRSASSTVPSATNSATGGSGSAGGIHGFLSSSTATLSTFSSKIIGDLTHHNGNGNNNDRPAAEAVGGIGSLIGGLWASPPKKQAASSPSRATATPNTSANAKISEGEHIDQLANHTVDEHAIDDDEDDDDSLLETSSDDDDDDLLSDLSDEDDDDGSTFTDGYGRGQRGGNNSSSVFGMYSQSLYRPDAVLHYSYKIASLPISFSSSASSSSSSSSDPLINVFLKDKRNHLLAVASRGAVAAYQTRGNSNEKTASPAAPASTLFGGHCISIISSLRPDSSSAAVVESSSSSPAREKTIVSFQIPSAVPKNVPMNDNGNHRSVHTSITSSASFTAAKIAGHYPITALKLLLIKPPLGPIIHEPLANSDVQSRRVISQKQWQAGVLEDFELNHRRRGIEGGEGGGEGDDYDKNSRERSVRSAVSTNGGSVAAADPTPINSSASSSLSSQPRVLTIAGDGGGGLMLCEGRKTFVIQTSATPPAPASTFAAAKIENGSSVSTRSVSEVVIGGCLAPDQSVPIIVCMSEMRWEEKEEGTTKTEKDGATSSFSCLYLNTDIIVHRILLKPLPNDLDAGSTIHESVILSTTILSSDKILFGNGPKIPHSLLSSSSAASGGGGVVSLPSPDTSLLSSSSFSFAFAQVPSLRRILLSKPRLTVWLCDESTGAASTIEKCAMTKTTTTTHTHIDDNKTHHGAGVINHHDREASGLVATAGNDDNDNDAFEWIVEALVLPTPPPLHHHYSSPSQQRFNTKNSIGQKGCGSRSDSVGGGTTSGAFVLLRTVSGHIMLVRVHQHEDEEGEERGYTSNGDENDDGTKRVVLHNAAAPSPSPFRGTSNTAAKKTTVSAADKENVFAMIAVDGGKKEKDRLEAWLNESDSSENSEGDGNEVGDAKEKRDSDDENGESSSLHDEEAGAAASSTNSAKKKKIKVVREDAAGGLNSTANSKDKDGENAFKITVLQWIFNGEHASTSRSGAPRGHNNNSGSKVANQLAFDAESGCALLRSGEGLNHIVRIPLKRYQQEQEQEQGGEADGSDFGSPVVQKTRNSRNGIVGNWREDNRAAKSPSPQAPPTQNRIHETDNDHNQSHRIHPHTLQQQQGPSPHHHPLASAAAQQINGAEGFSSVSSSRISSRMPSSMTSTMVAKQQPMTSSANPMDTNRDHNSTIRSGGISSSGGGSGLFGNSSYLKPLMNIVVSAATGGATATTTTSETAAHRTASSSHASALSSTSPSFAFSTATTTANGGEISNASASPLPPSSNARRPKVVTVTVESAGQIKALKEREQAMLEARVKAIHHGHDNNDNDVNGNGNDNPPPPPAAGDSNLNMEYAKRVMQIETAMLTLADSEEPRERARVAAEEQRERYQYFNTFEIETRKAKRKSRYSANIAATAAGDILKGGVAAISSSGSDSRFPTPSPAGHQERVSRVHSGSGNNNVGALSSNHTASSSRPISRAHSAASSAVGSSKGEHGGDEEENETVLLSSAGGHEMLTTQQPAGGKNTAHSSSNNTHSGVISGGGGAAAVVGFAAEDLEEYQREECERIQQIGLGGMAEGSGAFGHYSCRYVHDQIKHMTVSALFMVQFERPIHLPPPPTAAAAYTTSPPRTPPPTASSPSSATPCVLTHFPFSKPPPPPPQPHAATGPPSSSSLLASSPATVSYCGTLSTNHLFKDPSAKRHFERLKARDRQRFEIEDIKAEYKDRIDQLEGEEIIIVCENWKRVPVGSGAKINKNRSLLASAVAAQKEAFGASSSPQRDGGGGGNVTNTTAAVASAANNDQKFEWVPHPNARFQNEFPGEGGRVLDWDGINNDSRSNGGDSNSALLRYDPKAAMPTPFQLQNTDEYAVQKKLQLLFKNMAMGVSSNRHLMPQPQQQQQSKHKNSRDHHNQPPPPRPSSSFEIASLESYAHHPMPSPHIYAAAPSRPPSASLSDKGKGLLNRAASPPASSPFPSSPLSPPTQASSASPSAMTPYFSWQWKALEEKEIAENVEIQQLNEHSGEAIITSTSPATTTTASSVAAADVLRNVPNVKQSSTIGSNGGNNSTSSTSGSSNFNTKHHKYWRVSPWYYAPMFPTTDPAPEGFWRPCEREKVAKKNINNDDDDDDDNHMKEETFNQYAVRRRWLYRVRTLHSRPKQKEQLLAEMREKLAEIEEAFRVNDDEDEEGEEEGGEEEEGDEEFDDENEEEDEYSNHSD